MDEKVHYWFDIAEYDLDTARALLEKKRYVYVGFMCHQAIEKAVKAYWQSSLHTLPPKTHNLAYLLEKTGLLENLSDTYTDFIDELDPLNIECRYPEYKEKMHRIMNETYCNRILSLTSDFLAWLKQKLS
jgi:HEPN domain-containing protein